ncbi:MAG TPA: M28 family peptidase [Chitinophagales bacterium]|nr:M28 family peptidase [Chitinophagales bacterium]
MKFIYTSLLMCIYCFTINAQIPHPLINQLLKDMNEDSLLIHVNELTGEKSCIVKGKLTTIKNRVSKTGNDVAADYLKDRMESYGFTVNDQVYSTGGRNIIAEQKGALYPDKKYIICAHYDAVADYCADDNVSSCSAIIEIARLLSKHKFKYTIVYAFWDEEEVGLLGSAYYAKQAKKNNDNIIGVMNIEMLGYDSDDDSKYDIHTKSGSIPLSEKIKEINSGYALNLKPNIINPGTDRSDHGSFWAQGYSAICFGEAFFSGDANPSYHKSTDRLKLFNLPYYFELGRLSLAAIATFAEPYDVTAIYQDSQNKFKLETYPNPARESITVCYELQKSETLEISIFDITGCRQDVIVSRTVNAGNYRQTVSTEKLASGTYMVTIATSDRFYSKQILIEK